MFDHDKSLVVILREKSNEKFQGKCLPSDRKIAAVGAL